MTRFVAALSLVLALATGALAQGTGRTIVVFDASGSMWGQISGKAKITIAQEVMGELLATLPDDLELGLTAYGHRRKGDCSDIESMVAPQKGSRDAIRAAVNRISPKGRTPLSAAVIAAAEELKYTEDKATVILISDGVETCDFDPCEVGRRLEAAGVDFTAHVIGFDVADPAARAQLQCLAENTGGTFRTASDAAELSEALKVIAAPPPPPAPSPTTVRFVAVENAENGPKISDDLVWTLTNLDSGAVLIADKAVDSLNESLLPGRYRAEVLWAKNEASAALDVRVGPNTDTTFRLVLSYDLPDASLDAPATAVAGSTIKVNWDGPDGKGDWIGSAAPDDRDTAFVTYEYTSRGSPLSLRVPPLPGKYQLRYVFSERGAVLTSRDIEVTPVAASLDLPDQVEAGATVSVDWTGPGYDADYLSTAKAGDRATKYVTYQYTNRGAPLGLLMPTEPGTYEVRYVMNLGDTILATKTVEVVAVTAALDAPDSATAGETISVNWTGPGYDTDYISVARSDQRPTEYVNYSYTRNGNPTELVMPAEPGDYEIRYLIGSDNSVLATRAVTVTEVGAALTAKDVALIGETVEVTWTGPDYKNDYISVAAADQRGTEYLGYAYSRNGNPAEVKMPLLPGVYELRYILNQDGTILATRRIDVQDANIAFDVPDVARVGQVLEVGFEAPAWHLDYISIAEQGMRATKYLAYAYARNGSPAKLKLPSKPGAYEIRYIMNGSPDRILASVPITLEPVSATLSAPASATAGSGVIRVEWTGPGYPSDYIAIALKGSDRYLGYAYTRNGQTLELALPTDPGDYEIWYVLGNDDTVLERRPLKLE